MFHNFNFEPFNWKNLVTKYQSPAARKSIWQILNSVGPFMLTWALMYISLGYSYWLTLILAIPAAGFLVRIFIIQHDCSHGSFFKLNSLNNLTGRFCSLFTWTPYAYWKRGHGIHHASASNLENRGIGDVYTMTVKEYIQLSKFGRLKYRIYRNPLFLFLFIPSIIFVLWYRFPTSKNKALKKVNSSVYWTNLSLGILITGVILLTGWKEFLLIQLPITIIATSAGNWLFYVQHQFEDTYWAEGKTWDYTTAALKGSSYYKLPKVLQWFTGNIGFHHIHHLSPKIPNYMLEKCHYENSIFQKSVTLTLRSSLKSTFLTLWDEEKKKLIRFKELRKSYQRFSNPNLNTY